MHPVVNETRHHPGAYLRELLIWHDISAEELARKIELPCTTIVELTATRRRIDAQISRGLAGYFGNSAQYWLDLQNRFDRYRDRGTWTRTGAPSTPQTKKPADAGRRVCMSYQPLSAS